MSLRIQFLGYAVVAVGFTAFGYVGGQYDLRNGPDHLVDPDQYEVMIGPEDTPECQITATLSVWADMNRMGTWKWPVACVAALEELGEDDL